MRDPQPGDVYEFTRDVSSTAIDLHFHVGERLRLLDRTVKGPHGFHSTERSYNWIVEGPNGTTVWSSIEFMLDQGWIRLVEEVRS